MKTRLTNLKVYNNDKDGKPLKTKDGKPYTRMNIQIESHGDKWLSGFGNAQNKGWQIGDEIDVEVKENGQYLNFEMPKRTPQGGMSEDQFAQIITGQKMIMNEVMNIKALLSKPVDGEIRPEDVPF